MFYFHYIIGRSSLALGDPGVDLCLEIRVGDELFVLESMASASTSMVREESLRDVVERIHFLGEESRSNSSSVYNDSRHWEDDGVLHDCIVRSG